MKATAQFIRDKFQIFIYTGEYTVTFNKYKGSIVFLTGYNMLKLKAE